MWHTLLRPFIKHPVHDPILWRATRLLPGELYCGALSQEDALDTALDALHLEGGTRVLILDPDGLCPPWTPPDAPVFVLRPPGRADLILAARLAARFGAFGAIILPLSASGPVPMALPAKLAEIALTAPGTVWIVLTAGHGAPELRRGLRVSGRCLGF